MNCPGGCHFGNPIEPFRQSSPGVDEFAEAVGPFLPALVTAGALGPTALLELAVKYPGLAAAAGMTGAGLAGDPGRLRLVQRLLGPGGLRTSKTVADQLAGPRGYIPTQSILQTVGFGTRMPDPQGVAGNLMFRASAAFNGSQGTLEVLVNESQALINHVLFTTTK